MRRAVRGRRNLKSYGGSAAVPQPRWSTEQYASFDENPFFSGDATRIELIPGSGVDLQRFVPGPEPQGAVRKILIAAEDGSSINRQLLPYVAEPVALEGELLRRGDLEILLVDPAEIRRLS